VAAQDFDWNQYYLLYPDEDCPSGDCDSDCEGCHECKDNSIAKHEREAEHDSPVPASLLDLPFAVIPSPTSTARDPVPITPPATAVPPRDWVAEVVIIVAMLALAAGVMDLFAVCSGTGVDALSFPAPVIEDSDSPMQLSNSLFWGYIWLVLYMVVVEIFQAVRLLASGRRVSWINSISRALCCVDFEPPSPLQGCKHAPAATTVALTRRAREKSSCVSWDSTILLLSTPRWMMTTLGGRLYRLA
jgi:hypothetical protein